MTGVVIDVQVSGAERLQRLGAAIKASGDKELRRELLRAMQRSTKPLKQAARDGAAEHLPQRGGLAARVAASKFTARTRLSGRNPGVRVVGASDMEIARMDQGRLRHPVFGNRHNWVTQAIRPGWFTDAMNDEAPVVRDELVKAIDEVAAILEARA